MINNVVGVCIDDNDSRLSEYKDKTAYYAYLVGQTRVLEDIIELLKLRGWKEYGFLDTKHKKNLSYYKDALKVIKSQLSGISHKTKIILKNTYGDDII